jgi:hypothetical protein
MKTAFDETASCDSFGISPSATRADSLARGTKSSNPPSSSGESDQEHALDQIPERVAVDRSTINWSRRLR